jgi:hypothetical protein
MILGVLLAFVVLSAVFSTGGENFMKHPLTDLRTVIAHPLCFMGGGLRGAVVCAAKRMARRQRTAEMLLEPDKEQKLTLIRQDRLTKQLEEQAEKYNAETVCQENQTSELGDPHTRTQTPTHPNTETRAPGPKHPHT